MKCLFYNINYFVFQSGDTAGGTSAAGDDVDAGDDDDDDGNE